MVEKLPEIPDKPVEDVAWYPVDGTFECHVCYELVDDALYSPAKHVLKWTCPNSHTSSIEANLG